MAGLRQRIAGPQDSRDGSGQLQEMQTSHLGEGRAVLQGIESAFRD